MPAATFVEGEFEENDIWHLINFVRSLGQPSDSEILPEPTSDQVTTNGELADPSNT